MLIAQISDPHLCAPGALTFGHVDTAGALARVVAHINAIDPLPDMAIVTGDLTNDGSEAETRHALAVLTGLACPFTVIPGNHDDRAVLRRVFGARHCPAAEGGFVNFSIEGQPLRLIALDTVDAGRPGGAFCASRAGWLEVALAAAPDQPAMLFLHHPPLPLGLPETDHDGFRGASDLGRIIARHGNIRHIAAGHVHLAIQTMWQGVPVSTAPSTAMQLTRDFAERGRPSRFVKAAPGYLLHHLNRAGLLSSQVVWVGGDETSFAFAPLPSPLPGGGGGA